MEQLDVYDENMLPIGVENRNVVHQKGLWHKTVHCWLYDKQGNVYFQIRKDSGKLYTTASGHVLAGETLNQAFQREVLEEIGIDVDTRNATLVEINAWRMDKVKNGVPFLDRAFANVYINCLENNFTDFKFDKTEVLGLVKVNASQCLELLKGNLAVIDGERITKTTEPVQITMDDFLIFPNEIGLIKYGKILQSILAKQNG